MTNRQATELSSRIPRLHSLIVESSDVHFCDSPLLTHTQVGSVANDRFLRVLYSAADLFVIPSLQDNLPNTVLESLACGTPVVGFNIGGIPDMVREGETVWLVQEVNASGLSGRLAEVLSNETSTLNRMRQHCRHAAKSDYSLTTQAMRYREIFRHKLLG